MDSLGTEQHLFPEQIYSVRRSISTKITVLDSMKNSEKSSGAICPVQAISPIYQGKRNRTSPYVSRTCPFAWQPTSALKQSSDCPNFVEGFYD